MRPADVLIPMITARLRELRRQGLVETEGGQSTAVGKRRRTSRRVDRQEIRRSRALPSVLKGASNAE
jgi:DNA-binding transcriptional regulator YhcF (GntR family)